MKNLIYLFLLLFIFSACSSRPKLTKPFYWKMSYKGREYYFLGTMHDNFKTKDLPTTIQNDIANSDVVYVEMTEEYMKTLGPIVNEYYYGDFPELKKQLSQVAWSNYHFAFDSFDFKNKTPYLKENDKSIEKYHPCLSSTAFLDLISEKGEGYYEKTFPLFASKIKLASTSDLRYLDFKARKSIFGSRILDTDIEHFAHDHDKEVKNLDNAGTMGAIVEKLATQKCLAQLEVMLGNYSFAQVRKSFEEGENITAEIKKLFIAGDEIGLKKLILSNDVSAVFEDIDLNTEVILARNKYWFDTLNLSEFNKIFVAGGVAHFLGDQSVLYYFKDRGAIIEKQSF